MKEAWLLRKIPERVRKLSATIFITIIIVSITINILESLESIHGRINIILFAICLITCLYAKISDKHKITISVISLLFFHLGMWYYNDSFVAVGLIAFYLPVIYGYIIKNIYVPIVSGVIAAINMAKFMSILSVRQQVYGSLFGLIFATIGFTTLYHMFRKISYQRDMYKQLSLTDTLTGVANLNYILELGDRLISKGGRLTAYVLDIDHFKQVNDTFGHFIGNQLLMQIANTLKAFVKDYDGIVGRLGGDEFVVLIKSISENEAGTLLDKLTIDFKDKYFDVDKELTDIKITVAVGMAHSEDQSIRIQELLHLADINMYYNKQQSQGIIVDKNLEEVLNEEKRRLLEVLCEKDVYSFVHSQFVVQYATGFARYLGLSAEQIRSITLAAWLHDIGKLVVPNEILRKRGKLTDEEYTIIKSHVVWGVTMLSKFQLSESILEGVRFHHERYDGKGYPYGIKGDNTPVSAKIIQIADSCSAMTIKRVYREKLEIKDALKEIERCKGTQFDPYLAEKFIEFATKEYVKGKNC